jgi:hypothetical protein
LKQLYSERVRGVIGLLAGRSLAWIKGRSKFRATLKLRPTLVYVSKAVEVGFQPQVEICVKRKVYTGWV